MPSSGSMPQGGGPEEEGTEGVWLAWAVTQLLWGYCFAMNVKVSVLLAVWWVVPGVVRGKWTLEGWVESYFRACALWYVPIGNVSACMLAVGVDWRVWEQALLAALGLGCVALSEGGFSGVFGVGICLVCVAFKATGVGSENWVRENTTTSRLMCLVTSSTLMYFDQGSTFTLPTPPLLFLLTLSSLLLPPTHSTPTPLPEPFFAFLLTWFFTDSLPSPYSVVGACELAAAVGLNFMSGSGYREGDGSNETMEDDEEEKIGYDERVGSRREYPKVHITLGEE